MHHLHQLTHQYSLPQSVQTPSNVGSAFRAAPLPPVPQTLAQAQSQANNSAQSPEDSLRTIERLVEHMGLLNMERLRKLSESKPISQAQVNKTDVELLNESIRVQSEQNQVLRRVFGELEKELRSLTETRIELEIKLDYLNTAQINSSSSSSVVKKGVQAKNSVPATPVSTTSNASTAQTVGSQTPAGVCASGMNGTPSIGNGSSTSKIII